MCTRLKKHSKYVSIQECLLPEDTQSIAMMKILCLYEQIKHALFAQIRPELLRRDLEFEQLK